ncbi:MAG: sulfotransferase family 2 domain-containing protein [Anaerolineae bacterium]
MSTSEPTVLFLHIPKTAGSTLNNLIWRQYQKGETFDITPNQPETALAQLTPAEQATIRFVTGHMYFGLHQKLAQPAAYLTILRDPVDLVISFYYYVRYTARHPLHRLAAPEGENMSLVEFALHSGAPEVKNGQIRRLAGMADGRIPCTRGHLETAKRNMQQKFIVVGLTEAFDETLLLIRRRLGWRHLYYARMNTNPFRQAKEAVGPDTIAVIQEVNQLDIELYQYAAAQFWQTIRQEGESFAAELRRFRRMNRLAAPFLFLYWRARSRLIRAWRK